MFGKFPMHASVRNQSRPCTYTALFISLPKFFICGLMLLTSLIGSWLYSVNILLFASPWEYTFFVNYLSPHTHNSAKAIRLWPRDLLPTRILKKVRYDKLFSH